MEQDLDRVLNIVGQLEDVVYNPTRELPRITRNFKQLMEAGDELFNRHSTTEASDAEGIAFLGSRGLDIVAAKRILDKFQDTQEVSLPEEPDMWDIPRLMESVEESIVIDFLGEVQDDINSLCDNDNRHRTFLRFQDLKNQMTEAGQEEFLLGPSYQGDNETYAGLATVLNITRAGTGLNADQTRYIRKVVDHNREVITGSQKMDLLNRFLEVPDEMKSEAARNRWTLLLNFKPLAAGAVGQDVSVYRATPSTIDEHIRLARTYLEDKYIAHVEKAIWSNMNLYSVEVTTRPGRFELIRNYWRSVILPQLGGFYDTPDNEAAGVPSWPFLFYALRSGDLDVAMEVVDIAGLGLADVKKYIQEMKDSKYKRVSPQSQAAIRMAYKGGICQTLDIYKKAVYCIMGACDFEDVHEYICVTTDDYMWLKLCQLRGDKEPAASGKPLSSSTFFEFQKKLAVDFGEGHFNASRFPDLYFMVLVLSGQFERAFEFFFRVEGIYTVEAIHMAMAMRDIGLLSYSKLTREAMLVDRSEDPPGTVRLNLGRMLVVYAKAFYKTNPVEALHYYYQLLGFQYRDDDAFLRLTAELVLDIGNAEYFLGKLTANWTRLPGTLDEFRQDTNSIIKRVADGLLSKRQIRDAVNILLLCGEENRAVMTLLTELAPLVGLNPEDLGPRVVIREQLLRQASELLRFMAERGTRGVAQTNYEALVTMMNIAGVYELFYGVQMRDALEELEKLAILPFEAAQIEPCADGLQFLHPQIQRTVPDLMVAAMQMLFQLYSAARAEGAGKKAMTTPLPEAEEFHRKALAIVSFGGMAADHISGDAMMKVMQVSSMM